MGGLTVKMVLLGFLFLLVVAPGGCANHRPWCPKHPDAVGERVSWSCMADIDRNSKCSRVDCDYAMSHCSEFGDRVMIIYPLKEVFFYRLHPLTDMDACRASAGMSK